MPPLFPPPPSTLGVRFLAGHGDCGTVLWIPDQQQVCFSEEGAQTVCASDLALQSDIDQVLVKQGLLEENLEDTRNEIVEIVKTTLTPLEAELAAATELAAAQSTTIESIQEELDGHCGRHCYPGEYVTKSTTHNSYPLLFL